MKLGLMTTLLFSMDGLPKEKEAMLSNQDLKKNG
jgi:hypothetical protein